MDFNGRDYWDASVSLTPAARQLHSTAAITAPYDNASLDLTIFVSCYNEESSIIDTLETISETMRVVGKSYEVIVIDDASSDGSVEKVRGHIAAHPELRLMLRANRRNKGLAQNYIDGAFIGCGKYYRLVCGSDVEPMEAMVDIFRSLGDADIIVPYDMSAETRGHRAWCRRLYTRLINVMTHNRINDYNSRQIHLRYNVMRWHAYTRGCGFHTDLLCRLLDLGFTCKQVPCRMPDRRRNPRGKVTMCRDVLSMAHCLFDIAMWRFSKRVNKK